MSHDASKVVKCCKEGGSGRTKKGLKLVSCFTFSFYDVCKVQKSRAVIRYDRFKPTSMELYRCLEKLYSMSRAVKLSTAKSSALSCPLSGRSHTNSHDIFSTVWPASYRMPSKRSNRSTQWYSSHCWRHTKKHFSDQSSVPFSEYEMDDSKIRQ